MSRRPGLSKPTKQAKWLMEESADDQGVIEEPSEGEELSMDEDDHMLDTRSEPVTDEDLPDDQEVLESFVAFLKDYGATLSSRLASLNTRTLRTRLGIQSLPQQAQQSTQAQLKALLAGELSYLTQVRDMTTELVTRFSSKASSSATQSSGSTQTRTTQTLPITLRRTLSDRTDGGTRSSFSQPLESSTTHPTTSTISLPKTCMRGSTPSGGKSPISNGSKDNPIQVENGPEETHNRSCVSFGPRQSRSLVPDSFGQQATGFSFQTTPQNTEECDTQSSSRNGTGNGTER